MLPSGLPESSGGPVELQKAGLDRPFGYSSGGSSDVFMFVQQEQRPQAAS